jgi:hypothetical protein
MDTISQLTKDDLENLIEQKVLEILGDPDADLDLRDDFKEKLRSRIEKRVDRIPHQEVMKRFG